MDRFHDRLKKIVVGNKTLYAVRDMIPGISDDDLSKMNVTYLEDSDGRQAYADKEQIDKVISKKTPMSGFDSLLGGILNVPKE